MFKSSLIVLAFGISLTVAGDVIPDGKFVQDPNGMTGEEVWKREIEISPELRLPAVISVTVRRNGTLKIANLSLRVIDEYDDGMVFERGRLHVEFTDISGDGLKDLVVSGIVVHTGERAGDRTTREVVTQVYFFDPNQGHFRLVYNLGPKLDL